MDFEVGTFCSSVREFAKKELVDIVDSISGSKALVLDPSLSGSLGLITEYSLLKEHGVGKIYLLGATLDTDCSSLIYLCRPSMQNMTLIAGHIKAHRAQSRNTSFNLFFVPRRTVLCERVLEEEGVLGDKTLTAHVTIGEYHLALIPLDTDVLSLEMDSVFKDLYLDGDYSCLYPLSTALMRLQALHGYIPKIYGKGHYSKILADLLVRRKQEQENDQNLVFPEFDQIIILDRNIDLMTPLLTQLTYEGLIDEVFDIDHSVVELEPMVSGFREKRKIPLNSSDPVFAQVRNMSFSAIGTILSTTAKQLQKNYDERHSAQTVTALKEFIDINIRDYIFKTRLDTLFHEKLELEQNLFGGADVNAITDYIENLLYQPNFPLVKILRLLCLTSVLNGGLKQKTYDFFRQEILQTYGYYHLVTLEALSKCGLLQVTPAGLKPTFPTLRKQLRLKVDDVNDQKPEDIAYTHAVIAPLSIRLVETILKNQTEQVQKSYLMTGRGSSTSVWRGIEDSLRALPGPSFEIEQKIPVLGSKPLPQSRPRKVVVLFLGGCTSTEISSLRFLAEKSENQYEFTVITSKVINGNKLLSSFLPKEKDLFSLAGTCMT